MNALAFSPREPLLASAGEDGTTRLWAPDSGLELRRLVGHRGPVTAVTFTPDGAEIVTAGDDGTIRVWNAADGTETRLVHVGRRPGALAFDPTGLSLAVGFTHAGAVEVLDFATGVAVDPFWLADCLPTRVYVAFTREGRFLVAVSMDGHTREAHTLFVWSMETKERVFFRESGCEDNDGFLAMAPGGDFFIAPEGRRDVLSLGRTTRYAAAYAVGTWEALSELPRLQTCAVLPSGEITGAGHSSRRVIMTLDGKTNDSDSDDYDPLARGLSEIAVSKVTPLVARAGERSHILIEDTTSDKAFHSDMPRTAVVSVSFSSDDTTLLALFRGDRTVRSFDVRSGALLERRPLFFEASDARQWLAGGCALELEDGGEGVELWNWTTGSKVSFPSAKSTKGAAVSSDGRFLAIGEDSKIAIFDARTGDRLRQVRRPTDEEFQLELLNDGTLVFLGGGGRGTGIEPWVAREGAPVSRVTAEGDSWTMNACFSPDARLLAAPWCGREMRLLEVATGRPRAVPVQLPRAVAVTFSMSGRFLAVGDVEGNAFLFDLRTGAWTQFSSGHDGPIVALAVSHDESLLATGGDDATVLVTRIHDRLGP